MKEVFFFKEVEKFEKPIEILTNESMEIRNKSRMSDNDLAFLCGLIKKYKPKKLMEVGVANGGTTTVIANCLSICKISCEIHSVDLMENFFGEKAGQCFENMKNRIDMRKISHRLYLGKPACEVIQDIGKDIDFLIIDTCHGLPGEVLEFLTLLPYLSEHAVVVIHDLADHHLWKDNDGLEYATQLLFDCVVADKYLIEDLGRIEKYPNIGAFVVNSDTRKYVGNCFAAMCMSWLYMPDQDQWETYMNCIRENYSEQHVKLLEAAYHMNAECGIKKREKKASVLKKILDKRVYIYGAGKIGKDCYQRLWNNGIEPAGFVVSDDQIIESSGVRRLSEIQGKDSLFILAIGNDLMPVFIKNLEKHNFEHYIAYEELKQIIGVNRIYWQ